MFFKRRFRFVFFVISLIALFLKLNRVTFRYILNLNNEKPSVFQILLWHTKTDANMTLWPEVPEGLTLSETYPGCKLKPQHTCVYTFDRSKYESSHAVLFNVHAHWLGASFDTPQIRPTGQKWIIYQRESPIRTHTLVESHFNNLFNITATYRFDSDIHVPYGTICTINEERIQSTLIDEKELEFINAQIVSKTSLIAWFVSNCRTPSRREYYVKELKRYVPVHIYGKCSNMTIHTNKSWDSILNTEYMFYLSFENSVCEDYITEKFFRMRMLNVVPIVMGGGDYSKYSPPGTYINVKDFPSPKHLAGYIRLLEARPDLYAEYLLRKRGMVCTEESNFLCLICEHLHENAGREQRVVLSEFWNQSKQCVRL